MASSWSTTTTSSTTKAVGAVDPRTQRAYDNYQGGTYTQDAETTAKRRAAEQAAVYREGDKVTGAYTKLQNVEANKPGEFSSAYKPQLDNIYNQIMNRDPFSYNVNSDALYQQYKNQYTNQGRTAMKDTIAQASALTGGYANSYAQTAGQQTYQNYLSQLNEIMPTLYNQAYQRYQDEGQNLQNKYNMTKGLYDTDYGQWRDRVSDWQTDRNYYYGQYQDERTFDYNRQMDYANNLWNQYTYMDTSKQNQYNQDRSYNSSEYWNQKNSATQTDTTSNTQSWTEDVYSGGGGGSRSASNSNSGYDYESDWGDYDGYDTPLVNSTAHLSNANNATRDIVAAINQGRNDNEKVSILNGFLKSGKISVLDYNELINRFGLTGVNPA